MTVQEGSKETAAIEIDVAGTSTPVDRMIYGHFLESDFFGNIEGGVFDEGSPQSYDGPGARAGLRRDVIEACRELGLPIVRWPGGNFTSAYHWEDGIGPREDRPRRLDLTWQGEESNRFGTDEFLAWCSEVGTEPFLVNAARNIDESVRWLEYTNYAGDTAFTRERAKNGHPEPYGVRYWGVGNEVYGPWQMGHRSAEAYAADATEHARFMRILDPDLKLVAVGNGREEWLRPLLTRAGNMFDYISHHLYGASTHLYTGADAYADTVAQSLYFEDSLAECCALLESLTEEIGIDRPLSITLEEWNMRHLEPAEWPEPLAGEDGGIAPRDTPEPKEMRFRVNRWSPRTMADGIFYAGVLHTLHRLAGRRIAPSMANTVNLINANALIAVREQGLVRSTTYHVWDLYQNHMGSETVPVTVQTPGRRAEIRQGDRRIGDGNFLTRPGNVPSLDVIATRSSGSLQLAVINRERDTSVVSTIRLSNGALPNEAHVHDLGAGVDDVFASNSLSAPDQVTLVDRGVRSLQSSTYEFPAHSITLLSFDI